MKLIDKKELVENYDTIIKIFRDDNCFGKVHTLETPCEGDCTLYYVELKEKHPSSQVLQLAKLWKFFCLNESPKKPQFVERFNYLLESWNPRELEKKDMVRVKNLINSCTNSINAEPNKSAWLTRRKSGYYLNNTYKQKELSPIIVKQLSHFKNRGTVITDDWNDLTILFESNGFLSLFVWQTFA